MFGFLRSATANPVQRIEPRDAVTRAKAGELTLVDVRDISELGHGRAEGAIHVPLMLVRTKCDPASPEKPAALDPARPVALYCASGARSQMAAQMLAEMGYEAVYNLGGLGDWHAGGGRVVR